MQKAAVPDGKWTPTKDSYEGCEWAGQKDFKWMCTSMMVEMELITLPSPKYMQPFPPPAQIMCSMFSINLVQGRNI